MIDKSLAVLIAAPVSDVLVLRRLLRDSRWHVDSTPGATLALRAISKRDYDAVIADDEGATGLSGAQLLASVEELSPRAARILVARRERRTQLASPALAGRFQLFVRPYFAAPVARALIALERARAAAEPRRPKPIEKARAPVEAEPEAAALEGDTQPYALGSGGAGARRRVLLPMAELAEAAVDAGPGHAGRVSALAVALGRAVGLGPIDLEALDEAALLHDVGELGPGANALRLRRRLTASELDEVHLHPGASARIAERCGVSKLALGAIEHHHERWDGRGYPNGLKLAKIPVMARIVAVADTWDALVHARPYRASRSLDEAVRTLKAAAGAQLDPALVELFSMKALYDEARNVCAADPDGATVAENP
ncbi:MAG TPA: HD domain-containing phosphohydrolase [Polyangia bacterium]